MINSKKNIVLFLLITVFFSSCNKKKEEKKEEKIATEYEAATAPNTSDRYFAQAIKELEAKKGKEAAKQINEGVVALRKEGANTGGLYKVNLDLAVEQLAAIENMLTENKMISVRTLKEVIANAEINIAHNYLVGNESYTLEDPETKINNSNNKHLTQNVVILKDKEIKKIKVEVKEEREALLHEGEKLEEEMKVLQEKIKVHTKKTEEHIKKNYPETYEEWNSLK